MPKATDAQVQPMELDILTLANLRTIAEALACQSRTNGLPLWKAKELESLEVVILRMIARKEEKNG